jgi:penicillin-binding protein 2
MQPSNQVRRTREGRAALLRGLVIAGFCLVAIGLIRLQVVQHDKYLELSKENHVRLEVLRAPRGIIYDRRGVLLADSAPSFDVVFRPFPAESTQRARQVIDASWVSRVVRLLDGDSEQVQRQVAEANASGQTMVLMHNAPFAVWAAVEESRDQFPGLDVQVEPIRRYPYGILAAHLLGYAGEINERELTAMEDRGYRSGDLIGRSGVERTMEEALRGRDGAEFVVVNASGRRVSTLSEGPPQLPTAGHDVVLTLDLQVQQALEEVMADVSRGAAVALDPRDGGVLGMVSRPAFDPNEFSVGLTQDRWHELTSGGSNPLLNRAIQGLYPPGSTFKVVTMLAALRSGVAQPATHMATPCLGRLSYGGRFFACWKPSGHGSLTLVEALQHSCDVYFYQLGLRLGLDRLEETARALGLGSRTGIDLPQEKGGLVPSAAWYNRRWGEGKWRKGLLLNLAIGQGELLVTPLQIATMLAETAMNGRALRPHVVKAIAGLPGFRAEGPTRASVTATPEEWDAVHQGLELVVSAGTGTAARVPGLRVGGKTGTAQNPHGKDHALFICYAPVEDPSIVLAFVIENSGHGGSIAAPRAGQVLSRLFLPDSLQHPAVRRVAPPDTVEASHGD